MNWINIVSCIVIALQVNLDYILASSGTVLREDEFLGRPSDPEYFSGNMENESGEIRTGYSNSCNEKYQYYRTFDGSCNNYKNPEWGTTGTTFVRYLMDSYSDGIYAFPRSKSNEPLVSAREISLKIFPDVEIEDNIWTLLTLQWGQLIAHDLANTANLNPPDCCSEGKFTAREHSDPKCASIPIPPNDPYNGPAGNECYNFYRSDSRNNIKPNDPITTSTAYMDTSMVYGSTSTTAKDLRSYEGGRLKSEKRNGQEWLPQNHNVMSTCPNVSSLNEPCYRAGDPRVNQNTHLSVQQNILLREHNRIADYLCSSSNGNRHWNDEKCFQVARKILIAMVQHINYYEYLPILLGQDNMVRNKLIYPDADGYVNDYDPTISPAVLVEFATGAFRDFHSSIVGQLRLYLEDRLSSGSIRLSDYMNKPVVIEQVDNFNQLTRGLSTQHQGAVDRFYTAEVTQYLFRSGEKLGQDLRSLDIQRSRDHGVGTYVNALIACNLSNPRSFKDLNKYMPSKSVRLLQEVYKYVEDVELIVAAALEDHVTNTFAGPTFLCIMTEQFLRTRRGDRFFYENGNYPGAFTPEQLNSIREGSTAASMLCNVDGIEQMQPQAFLKISKRNSLVPCGSLPQVDLSLWKENDSSWGG